VLFTPVSVASDASVHVVPSSCNAGDVVDVAFGEGVTLLVHPAAAAMESNSMLISKTREIFLIISSSPRQEIEVALDSYVIAQCRYSHLYRV
jgi:hypothetical protein